MSNHPNRSRAGSPSRNPSPGDVRAARAAAGITQAEAAALVHATRRAWEQWELEIDDPNHRRMHPACWELFQIKIKISSKRA